MRGSGLLVALLGLVLGCTHQQKMPAMTGQRLPRCGDEIMVCGQLFHTGAPVVLWTDPGGYDAYRTERRFVDYEKSSFAATTREEAEAKAAGKTPPSQIESPNRYSLRRGVLTTQQTA